MSVTLKLADEDAKLIGNVLNNVAKLQEAALSGKETVLFLKAMDRTVSSPEMIKHLNELSGAFRVAARANER